MHPDPSDAYDEAIRAVEAAAIPVVEPNNAGATLGHVLGQLANQGHLYEVAITDKGLYAGISNRRVRAGSAAVERAYRPPRGKYPCRAGKSASAEMAVHLAAALVQWFTSGAIRRRGTQ